MNIRKPVDYSEMYAGLDKVLNSDMQQMKLFCEIGKVDSRPEKGAAVAAAEYINNNYSGRQGFSPRSLRRMRDFYRSYKNDPVLMDEAMKVCWSLNAVIIESCESAEERAWYIQAVQTLKWSKTELVNKIAECAHETIQIDILDIHETTCYTKVVPASAEKCDATLMAQKVRDSMRTLTQRQRKKFEEERARQILAYIHPEKYEKAILSESPDIVNVSDGIGVEVTNSMRSDIQESISRASKITGKTDDELTQIDRKNIELNRVHARKLPNDTYIAGTIAFWGDFFDFKKIYGQKLKKLNAIHFSRFQENNLFIFAWLIDDEEVARAIEYFSCQEAPNEYEYNFDFVFIFCDDVLVEIELATRSVIRYPFSQQILREISRSAYTTITEETKESISQCVNSKNGEDKHGNL